MLDEGQAYCYDDRVKQEDQGTGAMMYEPGGAPGFGGRQQEPGGVEAGGPGVERQLAQYAFVREERDREVRLHFREAQAPNIVAAFREAGATLISITGERVLTGGPAPEPEQTDEAAEAGADDARPRHSRKAGSRVARAPLQQGEVLLRYFFALRETVYTVSLTSPSGVTGSVSGIYPSAYLLEQDLQARLAMVLTSTKD
jgi:hypothetical protein